MLKVRNIIFFFIIIFIISISVISYLIIFPYKQVSPLGTGQPKNIPSGTQPIEMATWNDQSEFNIRYPVNLTINKHAEDNENYTHLEFTSATHSGNLIIWVKDSDYQDIDDWVKHNNISSSIDSALGEEKAKKFLISDNEHKVTVAAIRSGYLYLVEATLTDASFWNSVFDSVVKSFKFTSENTEVAKPEVKSGNDGTDISGGDESEEEETIE